MIETIIDNIVVIGFIAAIVFIVSIKGNIMGAGDKYDELKKLIKDKIGR